MSARILIGIDEDVRKGCGRVADVHTLFEGVEKLTYPTVDDGGILIIIGR